MSLRDHQACADKYRVDKAVSLTEVWALESVGFDLEYPPATYVLCPWAGY